MIITFITGNIQHPDAQAIVGFCFTRYRCVHLAKLPRVFDDLTFKKLPEKRSQIVCGGRNAPAAIQIERWVKVIRNCTLCEINIIAHPGTDYQCFTGLKLHTCAILLRGFCCPYLLRPCCRSCASGVAARATPTKLHTVWKKYYCTPWRWLSMFYRFKIAHVCNFASSWNLFTSVFITVDSLRLNNR